MNLKDKNLLIISPFPGEDRRDIGAIFVKNHVEFIKDNFKEVTVISLFRFSLIPNFVYRIFGRKFLLNDPIGKDYKYANVSVYCKRHVYFSILYRIPIVKKILETLLGIIVVEKIIKKYKIKFDIIDAHFTQSGNYAIYLKKRYHKPVVVTIHENRNWFLEEYNSGDERIYNVWEKADVLIRVNKKDVPLLRKYNNNVVSICSGFNPKIFHRIKDSRAIVNLPKDKKIILSVGSLIERKCHKYLIAAICKIVNIRNDILCLIIGEGPLKEELQKQINDLNLNEYVKLTVGKPHDEIPLWMNACDLFVLPSLSESFGNVQIEAMACGKPVVATRNGGSEEIIVNDDLGFLVETKNSEQLADAILKALNNKWDSDYIVKYAEQFTWNKHAEKTLEVYKSVCK